MEALVPPECEQDRNVLQNNQHADEEQHSHLADTAAARPVPLPRVVVVADDDSIHPFLQYVPHPATAEGATALDKAEGGKTAQPGRVTTGILEPLKGPANQMQLRDNIYM